MKGKRFFAVAAALILCLCALCACGADYKSREVAPAANKIDVTYKDSQQNGYTEFLTKINAFAAKLSAEVIAQEDGSQNVCISPISVYMALALACECSAGETREELLNAVGVSYEEVSNFTKYLYAFCNRDSGANFAELANSVWTDERVKLNETGINNLAQNFNCDLFSTVFSDGSGEKYLNAYIKDKTHGLIDSDLKIPPETVIALVNTFYLKEIWNEEGDNLSFADGIFDFLNNDGTSTQTKLLQGYYNTGKVYDGGNYTTFFTQTEHGYKIKFIVPKDGYSPNEIFTAENIETVANLSDYDGVDNENKLIHKTRVLFPEYEAEYDGNLKNVLQNRFGVEKLFTDKCDFSNLTDASVFCTEVRHKSKLKVTAKGVEGAAVTVMLMAESAAEMYESVYQDFVVDKAFGFVLTDSYGAVLFCGVVNNVE